MKKTISAALGGLQFTFTEDSYHQLNTYLDDIKSNLDPMYREETLRDIESRCAEILSEKLATRQVVEQYDIDHVISVLGKPSDFADDSGTAHTDKTHSIERRKLFRDPDGKIIGGVASGIAYYFGIHVAIIRLIFILMVIFSGFGILTYIILWMVLPKAISSVDKLMMKGEKIHFKKIEETIKNELDSLKRKSILPENITSLNWLNRIFNFFGNIIGYLLRFFGRFIGFILLISAMALLIVFFFLLISSFAYLSGTFEINSFSITSENIKEYIHLFFGSKTAFNILLSAFILSIFSILVLIGYFVRYLFGNSKSINRNIVLFTIFIFLASSTYILASISQFSTNFRHSSSNILLSDIIPAKQADTLYVIPVMEDMPTDMILYIQNGVVHSKDIEIKIEKSFDSNINILSKVEAKGSNKQAAFSNCQNINFDVKIEKNKIHIPSSLSYSTRTGYRNQKAFVHLFIPENTIIYLPDAFDYEYAKDYSTQLWNFTSGYYKMTNDGLMKIN